MNHLKHHRATEEHSVAKPQVKLSLSSTPSGGESRGEEAGERRPGRGGRGEEAGERRHVFGDAPLPDPLPARSSRGEGKSHAQNSSQRTSDVGYCSAWRERPALTCCAKSLSEKCGRKTRGAAFGVRRLVAAFRRRLGAIGSDGATDAGRNGGFRRFLAPLCAALLGRRVGQADKAATSRRTPKPCGRGFRSFQTGSQVPNPNSARESRVSRKLWNLRNPRENGASEGI